MRSVKDFILFKENPDFNPKKLYNFDNFNCRFHSDSMKLGNWQTDNYIEVSKMDQTENV